MGEITQGTTQVIAGRLRVYYDGYWIKAYEVPPDTLEQRKRLIEALTRRLFNHVEHGLNVPGARVGEARHAFDRETDPQRKRVKGAMLAGALFNRATDIFTKIVEMQELGVAVPPDNALMRECSEHLQEAFSLGRLVLHRSGEEGIDELWGEPLKAFTFPVEHFYRGRYLKIALTMRAIDRICDALADTLDGFMMFMGIGPLLREFAAAAKAKSETLRTDPDIFDVWSEFVVAGEKLTAFRPLLPRNLDPLLCEWASDGLRLVQNGKDLVSDITRARVPMPKSAADLIKRCGAYRYACGFPKEELVGNRRSSELRTLQPDDSEPQQDAEPSAPRHSDVRALAPGGAAEPLRPRPVRSVEPAPGTDDSRAAS
jgi:hypothetical protein